MKFFILFLFLMSSIQAFAFRERALGYSPRGLLMGNAYTALADDEYTLFYNPAVLARHKGFTFTPINPQLRSVNILEEPDRFTNIGSDPNDFAGAAFDYPIHIGVDYSPGFKMGYFGFTGLYQNNTNLNLQNQVNPSLEVDHRFDKGFIAGVGVPMTGWNGLSLGASLKFLQRESVFGSYDLTGATLLDSLGAGEIEDILDSLGKIQGQGWGFDVGMDYVTGTEGSQFMFGLTALDVVTTLVTEDNENDLEVQEQPMQVHFGSAWKGSLGAGFDVIFSADIRNLNQQMEFMRRVHLGAEIGLSPALSLYAGVNSIDNYSYGLKFNAGLLKLYAGIYSEEIGAELGQQDADNFLVYLSLLQFSFDP